MDPAAEPMTDAEIERLVEALGDAPRVSYAPPNIYPMSAPAFAAASGHARPRQGTGPIGLYVHVPFCRYKCTFCFYATRPVPDDGEMARYVAAIEKELEWVRPGTELAQLYVGGGTPTALPPHLLDRLLDAVFRRVTHGHEVHTVECSPETLTDGHVETLVRHGIERVSMGVQTMDEGVLDAVNRRHDGGQVVAALERLLAAGLVVNVDLIYGLPGRTEDGFAQDFEAVARRGVHSITCYNLRVNERTPIGRRVGEDARLDASRLVRWRERARDVARACGFVGTRPHTFRRAAPQTATEAAGRFRDGTGWGDQLGAGVSARSRLGDAVYRNHSEYAAYLERVEGGLCPVEEVRALDDVDRRLRHVALTLGEGRPLVREAYEHAFATRFDDDFGASAARLARLGVVEDDGARLVLTDRGRLVYDLATRSFYPERVRRWMEDRQRLVETSPNLRSRVP